MSSGWRKSWKQPSFASGAVPFLVLIAFGSWGLSQFLKLPTQLKDERRKRKKEGREKFDLDKELEKVQLQLGDAPDTYENKPVPGPRRQGRVAAP